ncbi:MAG: hypothetical protein KTR16_14065 [Acidiferrobacterales bacterium]|nr:hypothetical protein [Acidiferrobacterales bacterium]
MKTKIVAILAVVLVLVYWSMRDDYEGPIIEDGARIEGATDNLVNLNQGWSEAMQAGFWYGGDGSMIIPYDYFLILEQASSTELFRSDQNIERLGYIPIPQSELNPDGMPVGFAKNYNSFDKKEWMAFNCAGCHATKITYKDTQMVINGAATMGDFQTLMQDLEKAMVATLEQDDKFERFAKKLLGDSYSVDTKLNLRQDFKEKTETQVAFNHTNRTQTKFGFGRVDAFAYAYNNIGVNFLGIPENHIPGIAPANYNFIWGTAQSDLLQWNGSAPNNAPITPIFRVLGDVWGSGGKAEMHAGKWPLGYKSSADFKGLGDMLSWVKDLQSPVWPESILPKINTAKAAEGRKLYEQHCVHCHELKLTREEQMTPYNAVMVPQTEVGTDRAELVLIEESVQKTGKLEGMKSLYFGGERLGPTTPAKNLLNLASVGVIIRNPIDTLIQGFRGYTGVKSEQPENLYQYKARPLNGIWATAPYLHNGSVPSLYQLLLPSEQRDQIFYTGNREFDPINIGFETSSKLGLFAFDTQLYGNTNVGHEYATSIDDKARFELLEFLKTL